MAQAARLNLRMQKELKLLLTDPPPAASFPTLSGDSSASSLASIDALLQGPEGTVYANGVFKIKIQIPERVFVVATLRYPFQPPIVTFATPMYHPNIDNGGRICLDILNLPPKGMWQPSLNISTVLTSIGLLLSEPNPDDGLMHEASRDYKYNRQAFDQNARSMTEKYARAGDTESGRSSNETDTHTTKAKMEGSGASMSTTELSLGSCSNEMYKVSTHDYTKNNIEFGPQANNDSSGKLQATRNKLSLKVSAASHNESEDNTSLLEIQTACTDSPESTLSVQVGTRDEDHIERTHNISVGQDQQSLQSRNTDEKLQQGLACSSRRDAIDRKGYCSTILRLKKQNHLVDDKKNLAPVQSAASTYISDVSETGLYCNESGKQVKNGKKQHQKMNDKLKQVGGGAVERSQAAAEAVIVLDSEESEDENVAGAVAVAARSKLSLAKRCCRKRKSPP